MLQLSFAFVLFVTEATERLVNCANVGEPRRNIAWCLSKTSQSPWRVGFPSHFTGFVRGLSGGSFQTMSWPRSLKFHEVVLVTVSIGNYCASGTVGKREGVGAGDRKEEKL